MFVKSIPWTRVKCGGCRGWKPIPGLLLCGIATSQRPNKGFVTTYTNILVCTFIFLHLSVWGHLNSLFSRLCCNVFLKLSDFDAECLFLSLFCTPLRCDIDVLRSMTLIFLSLSLFALSFWLFALSLSLVCSSHCCDINFPFAPCWPPPQEVEPGLFSAPWLLHFHSNTPRGRIKTQGFQGAKEHVLWKEIKSEQIFLRKDTFKKKKTFFRNGSDEARQWPTKREWPSLVCYIGIGWKIDT